MENTIKNSTYGALLLALLTMTTQPMKQPESPAGSSSSSSQQATPLPYTHLGSNELFRDYSALVKHQAGSTCGYHAVYNAAKLMHYLRHHDAQDTSNRLAAGPDIATLKSIILSHSHQTENIDDGDMEFLAFNTFKLPRNQLSIIPNMYEWSPELHENFAQIANELQTHAGSMHGFLINSGGHKKSTSSSGVQLNDTTKQEILNRINAPELKSAFSDYIKHNADISEFRERIGAELFEYPELLAAFIEMGSSSTYSGHWTAVIAMNYNGIIYLHVADSAYNQDTLSYGNIGVLERLYAWIKMKPQHLTVLKDMPNALETAKNIMLQGKIAKGLKRFNRVYETIMASDICNNPHYREHIEPLVNLIKALPDILTNLGTAELYLNDGQYLRALETTRTLYEQIRALNMMNLYPGDYAEILKPRIQAILATLTHYDQTTTPASRLLLQI